MATKSNTSSFNELYDENLIWCGSSNQRILILSNIYNNEDIDKAITFQQRSIVFSKGIQGDISVSSAQNVTTAQQLSQLTKLTRNKPI
jgi:hypothetical protein